MGRQNLEPFKKLILIITTIAKIYDFVFDNYFGCIFFLLGIFIGCNPAPSTTGFFSLHFLFLGARFLDAHSWTPVSRIPVFRSGSGTSEFYGFQTHVRALKRAQPTCASAPCSCPDGRGECGRRLHETPSCPHRFRRHSGEPAKKRSKIFNILKISLILIFRNWDIRRNLSGFKNNIKNSSLMINFIINNKSIYNL